MGSIEGGGEIPHSPTERGDVVAAPRQWALWSIPAAARTYLLAVDAIAIIVVAFSLFFEPVSGLWLTWFGLLVLALAQGELSRAIERTRRRFSGTVHVNMTSVWVFAGVLLLPVGLIGLLLVGIYLHLRVRSWYRMHGVHPYRMVAAAAALVLSSVAANWVLVLGGIEDISAVTERGEVAVFFVLLAAIAFFVADAAIIAVAAKLVQPDNRFKDVVGSWYDNALELATICLGAMAAIMLDYQRYTIVLIFIPLFVLHRSVLVKQLEETASKDQKTGLLNATAWHALAEKELERARRTNATMAVLMVDLDHFKRVNDTYGHIAGDEVLKATAKILKSEVRGYDSSGRFGGEEFAVLLPGTSPDQAIDIAERIRRRINVLSVEAPIEDGTMTTITDLSGSIGVAIYPHSGETIQALLLTADGALYTAKNSGRNRVVSLAT
jgi:diguanylate cyclase (GGDEF)-like protein